jgi:hypothetical protein
MLTWFVMWALRCCGADPSSLAATGWQPPTRPRRDYVAVTVHTRQNGLSAGSA